MDYFLFNIVLMPSIAAGNCGKGSTLRMLEFESAVR